MTYGTNGLSERKAYLMRKVGCDVEDAREGDETLGGGPVGLTPTRASCEEKRAELCAYTYTYIYHTYIHVYVCGVCVGLCVGLCVDYAWGYAWIQSGLKCGIMCGERVGSDWG